MHRISLFLPYYIDAFEPEVGGVLADVNATGGPARPSWRIDEEPNDAALYRTQHRQSATSRVK
jgi:hypothetical protein